MNKSKTLWRRCTVVISLLIFFPLAFIAVADAAVQYHAVIVGISDYEGTEYDLNYCDDDA